MSLLNVLNSDGTLKSSRSQIEQKEEKEEDVLFTAGKYIAAPLGEKGLRSDVYETSKALGAGAIQGNKELLKIIPRLASYAPYLRTPVDAAIAGGASLIAGMSNDRELDQAFDLSTMIENRGKEVEKIQNFLNVDQWDEALDEVAAPYLKALEKEYGIVSDTLTNVSNLTGQFISPMPALKALGYSYRFAKSTKLQGLVKNSHKVISDSINKQVKVSPDELKTIMHSPLERYKFLDKKRTNKKDLIELSPVAKLEIKNLEKYERKLNRISAKNKESLRSAAIYEGASAVAGAIAVNYIEDLAPVNKDWLAPLAGLFAAFFVPPVVIGHSRAISFNILANFSRYILKNEDVALNHFIRARGMNPNSIKDKNGVKITDAGELRKAKERILGTDVAQMRFYERLGKEIEKLPDEEKSLIYRSLENYQHVYDKIANKARARGLPHLADKFVPLVHNVLHLQGIRALQSSLLGQVNAGFFISPQRLFKTKLSSELDNLVAQQEMQVELLYKELDSLRALRDDNEVNVLLNEFTDMVADAQRSMNEQTGIITASGQDLSTILKGKTVGLEDLKLQDEATQVKRKFAIEEKISLNDPKEIADAARKSNVINNALMTTIKDKAKKRVNQAYNEAFKDSRGNEIRISSEKVDSKLQQLIDERIDETLMVKGQPSKTKLQQFRKELLKNNLSNLETADIITIGQRTNSLIQHIKNNKNLLPSGMSWEDFVVDYNIERFQSNFKKFQDSATRGDATEAQDSLTRYFMQHIFGAGEGEYKLSDLVEGTVRGDTVDTLRNVYQKSDIRLKDLHRMRVKYFDQLYKASGQASKSEASDMINVLDGFFEDVSDLSDKINIEKYQIAKDIYKQNLLPLRRKEILVQQKAQIHAQNMASDNIERSKLPEYVAQKDTGADDLFVQLIDSTLASSPAEAVQTLKTMKNLANDDVTFNRSIRRAFAKALNDEDAVNGRAFHNKFSRTFLEDLKEADIISTNDFNNLVKIPDFNTKTKGEVFKENQKIFDALIGDLQSIQKERGGVLAGGLLESAVMAGRKSKDIEIRNQNIADSLSVSGDQESIGLRFYAGKVEPDDARIRGIEERLGYEDSERFGQVLRGETGSFTVFKGHPTKEKTIRYPEEVDTPIAKLIYELDVDIEQGGEIAEKATRIKSALNDIFVSAIESRSFRRTNTASSLGNQPKTLAGNKQASGFLDNLDAPALETSVNMYRPYFEAIHKNPVKIRNPATGDYEDVDVLKELDDIVTISRSISQDIGGGSKIKGTPNSFSFDSILSRAWGIARGVVSPRYVISEMGLRHLRKGQSEILKEFLTDPTAVHAIHNVFVKGRTTTPYVRTFYQKLFGTPTWSILIQQTRTEDKGYLEAFFKRHGRDTTTTSTRVDQDNLSEGEKAILEYLEKKYTN